MLYVYRTLCAGLDLFGGRGDGFHQGVGECSARGLGGYVREDGGRNAPVSVFEMGLFFVKMQYRLLSKQGLVRLRCDRFLSRCI